jgi:protein arginine kinase activator
MRCQMCEKPATFHITELTGGQVREIHLCEEHARAYLAQADEEPAAGPSLAGALAQQLQLGQTAEELARLDQQSCPVCGITFYEFRNQGRLGCPNDYAAFQNELEPLINNIHGATEHIGKRPTHSAISGPKQTELIRLRREMKEAVEREQYEKASSLRDQIRRLEEEGRT